VPDGNRRLRVLVADDSPVMRRLVRALLAGIADEIEECTSGSDAIARYAEARHDWIVMDVEMDGLDGISATREIVRAHPDARILVLTQYDEPDIRDAVFAAGASAYLDKGRLLEIRKVLTNE
jgi:CheY-like chemotaxis protein